MTVKLDDDIKILLDEYCEKHNIKKTTLINNLINNLLEQHYIAIKEELEPYLHCFLNVEYLSQGYSALYKIKINKNKLCIGDFKYKSTYKLLELNEECAVFANLDSKLSINYHSITSIETYYL